MQMTKKLVKGKLIIKTGHQYKDDIFNKLAYSFVGGKKLLDVGCGDGSDAEIFTEKYGLRTYAIDIYKHRNIRKIGNLEFKKAGILKIPYKDNFFDYVFLHDVLHHVDELEQSYKKHAQGLKEVKRVCKKNGIIIILEANRYNPLSYPHMVLLRGHNHFKQRYFEKLINDVFKNNVQFKNFEAHFYPQRLLKLFKIYEKIMEEFSFLKPLLMYNVAIIENNK